MPIPAHQLFTYSAPSTAEVAPGQRVVVPFGKRELIGIVVKTHDVAPVHSERDMIELVDREPAISEHMLAFATWMSTYYLASLGETLRCALPQGMTPQSSTTIELIRNLSLGDIEILRSRAKRQAEIVEFLMQHKNECTLQHLKKALRVASPTASLLSLHDAGIIRMSNSRKKSIKERVQKCAFLSISVAELENNPDLIPSRAVQQLNAIDVLIEHKATSHKRALPCAHLATLGVPTSVLQALEKKSVVAFCHVPYRQIEVQSTLHREGEKDATLTVEQQHAVDKITPFVHNPQFKSFLVHGVTGSGKTLVYMQVIKEVLLKNKQALVLVPEISLTPQMIDRFTSVFETEVGIFHSNMTESERVSTWYKAKRGDLGIVIGARSALFAPLPNIGVIIVDEEHEPSYKQDHPAPRYHARDSAVVRAAMLHCPVVLGSATPSMESMFNAHTGKYHLLEILHRADGAHMPSVELVNPAEEVQRNEMHGQFSTRLLQLLEQALANNQHAIVLHNRRGYASKLECIACGHVPECPACSVALTVHKTTGTMRCHYCDYRRRTETACEKCGSNSLKQTGTGTQKVEMEMLDELREKFPKAVVERMDLDTTRKKGAHRILLEKFKQGEIDILVGTQMVARGLDFEHVGLAAVVNADVQLHLSDFRANERTFQLMTQVAGRAGRSSHIHGKVVIQTRSPRHHALIATAEQNYELFYSDELMERKQLQFPPFFRFTRIELRSKESLQVEQHAQMFASFLPKDRQDFVVQGPSTPSVEKLQGYFRKTIVVKSSKELDPSGQTLRHYLTHALASWHDRAHSAVRLTVDIDAHGSL